MSRKRTVPVYASIAEALRAGESGGYLTRNGQCFRSSRAYGSDMSVDAAPTFGPRTEAWIRRAVEEYELGLRRAIRDKPEMESWIKSVALIASSDYAGGD